MWGEAGPGRSNCHVTPPTSGQSSSPLFFRGSWQSAAGSNTSTDDASRLQSREEVLGRTETLAAIRFAPTHGGRRAAQVLHTTPERTRLRRKRVPHAFATPTQRRSRTGSLLLRAPLIESSANHVGTDKLRYVTWEFALYLLILAQKQSPESPSSEQPPRVRLR